MLHKAIVFATKAHSGQKRKGTDIDYISHPMEVLQILTAIGASETAQIAGILHDAVEDTNVTIEQIDHEFGHRVAALVQSESENKTLTWQERKSATLLALTRATREEKLLAFADKLSNIRSIADDYMQVGEKLWERFNGTKQQQRWYYTALVSGMADIAEEPHVKPLYEQFIRLVEIVFEQ